MFYGVFTLVMELFEGIGIKVAVAIDVKAESVAIGVILGRKSIDGMAKAKSELLSGCIGGWSFLPMQKPG